MKKRHVKKALRRGPQAITMFADIPGRPQDVRGRALQRFWRAGRTAARKRNRANHPFDPRYWWPL